MAKSPRSSRKARHDIDDERFVGGGIVARLAGRVFENPALSGGLVVMVLTAGAIVSNAMFLQRAPHPQPLFMTRPGPTLQVPTPRPDIVPTPKSRTDRITEIATASVDPPLPRAAPGSAKPVAPLPETGNTLITDLQRSLAARGLYAGAIDGIFGTRTRAAISAYQQAEGMPVTGEPSARVLDHIRTAALTPPAGPDVEDIAAPPPAPPTATEPPAAAVTASPEPAAAITPSTHDPERQRYLAVQRALNRIGYGPVPEDGWGGGETADALRRFALDNGLAITGLPDDKVVQRLIAIGAMPGN